MLSSSAIVWKVQQPTHAPGVSLATRNRNKLPPPVSTARTHTRRQALHSTPVKFSTPHTHTHKHPQSGNAHIAGAMTRQRAAHSHTRDLRGLESERSDLWQRACVHIGRKMKMLHMAGSVVTKIESKDCQWGATIKMEILQQICSVFV